MTKVVAQLKEIVAELAPSFEWKSDINSVSIRDDLNLDSMSTLTLLMMLEDKVSGFVVDPDKLDMEALKTLGSLAQFVESNIE